MQKPWALREVESIWRPGDQPQLSPGFHPAVSLPKGTALWTLEKLRNPQLFFFLNVPLKMSKVDEGVGCGGGGGADICGSRLCLAQETPFLDREALDGSVAESS